MVEVFLNIFLISFASNSANMLSFESVQVSLFIMHLKYL